MNTYKTCINLSLTLAVTTFQWRHMSVSRLLESLFRRTTQKMLELRIAGPLLVEFPSARTSNTETASMAWQHNDICKLSTGRCLVEGVKSGSVGVCCHNSRGCVRSRKSNPEADKPRILTYCSHKSECIVKTNTDRSVLITIITWHFQFHLVNVSICHSNTKREPFRVLLALLRHVVSLTDGNYRLTMSVGKGRCARDALPLPFDNDVFKTVKIILPQ